MDPDGKDFLLHLYDKLWENIAAKEGRLWSYLSVYGAAIALSLGVGQYAGVELYAVTIVLALTVWALLIVINANWWNQRNRLMVAQIEKRFTSAGTIDGVIPKSYQDPKFDFERLSKGSVLVLIAVASMLYLKLMWEHHGPDGFPNMELLASVALLYSLFLMSTMYCVSQYESYIDSFYSAKKALLEEAGGMTPTNIEEKVNDERKKTYGTYSWVRKGLLLLAFGISAFDLLPGRSNLHWDCAGVSGLLLQGLVIVIYLVIVKVPARRDAPWWRKTWLIQLVSVIVIAGSASIFLKVPYRAIKVAQSLTPQTQVSKAKDSPPK